MFASTIGRIGQPFYVACAWLLAEIYRLVPNYALAISLLTLLVMAGLAPLLWRGAREMMKMQLIAPELKRLQERYKSRPRMSQQERLASREGLNNELMALYRDNGVSPTAGLLPQLLQLPAFFVLYQTIRGLTHLDAARHAAPLYVGHGARLYHAIVSAGGALHAFGINLADSVRSPSLSFAGRQPFIVLILAAVALSYLQTRQLAGRNPAAREANPQMRWIQQILPLGFAVLYVSIPAALNLYFVVSSLFRVVVQEVLYRSDPALKATGPRARPAQALE